MEPVKVLTKKMRAKVLTLLKTRGVTFVDISRALNVEWSSVKEAAEGVSRPDCNCGKKADHEGFCRYRTRPKREAPEEITEVIGPLEIEVVPEGTPCREKACPFPIFQGPYCRQHKLSFERGVSITGSSMLQLEPFAYGYWKQHYGKNNIKRTK